MVQVKVTPEWTPSKIRRFSRRLVMRASGSVLHFFLSVSAKKVRTDRAAALATDCATPLQGYLDAKKPVCVFFDTI